MKSILFFFRLVSKFVRLLGFFSIGLEVIFSFVCSLLVIMWERVVLFNLGGLCSSIWFKVFFLFRVV